MKANNIVMAMGLGVMLIAGAANAANQGQGKITFKGSIIDAPCSIKAGDEDQLISLGQVSNKVLLNAGKSKPVDVQIHLEDCAMGTLKTVTTTFSGTSDITNKDLLAIAGTASGAGVALSHDGSKVELGKPTAAHPLNDGDNTLAFAAYLQGSGASVVPGDFTSVANFMLAYQ